MPTANYLPEAAADIDATYSDYEAQLAGLGDRFLRALARAVVLIQGNPHLYGEVDPGIRAAPLRRFPQVIYYRPEPNQVVVIAVRHGRDDPKIWRGRA